MQPAKAIQLVLECSSIPASLLDSTISSHAQPGLCSDSAVHLGVIHGALRRVSDALGKVRAVPAHVAVLRGDDNHLPVVRGEPRPKRTGSGTGRAEQIGGKTSLQTDAWMVHLLSLQDEVAETTYERQLMTRLIRHTCLSSRDIISRLSGEWTTCICSPYI